MLLGIIKETQALTMNDNIQHIEGVPHLNGEMLNSCNFEGCKISIIGKYLGQSNGDDKLQEFEASDGTKFTVKSNGPLAKYKTKYIEVRGYINTNKSITQISYQEYGNNFAMSAWDKFIVLAHQYPSLF